MLAQLRRPMPDGACAAAVCPDRKLGMPALRRLALDELWMPGRLARRDAEIDRHVFLVAQAQPFGRRPGLEDALELARQLIAVRAALRIGCEALLRELGCELGEVFPEMLLEDVEREALTVGGLEDIVHREEVRAGIDFRIQAVPHGGEKKRG